MPLLDSIELAGCLLWTISYAVMIRRQHVDRHYGFPLIVLALNFTWEVYHGTLLVLCWSEVDVTTRLELMLDVTWIALDLVLIWQAIRFAGLHGQRRYTLPAFVLLSVPSALFHILVNGLFREPTGYYSGFLTDLIMFFLVAALMRRRGSNRGFSLTFLVLTLVADMMMIAAFAGFFGFGLFPALFVILRATGGLLCLGLFFRNRE